MSKLGRLCSTRKARTNTYLDASSEIAGCWITGDSGGRKHSAINRTSDDFGGDGADRREVRFYVARSRTRGKDGVAIKDVCTGLMVRAKPSCAICAIFVA